MKCLLLHLSDIHIKGPLDPIVQCAHNIASTVYRQHLSVDATCIVLSGDIAFSGLESEYEAASLLVNAIADDLRRQKDIDIAVVAVPGNHDCDFSKDTVPRRATIDHVVKSAPSQIDVPTVELCTAPQESFFGFLSRLSEKKEFKGLARLYWTRDISVCGRLLRIHGINASWLSKLNEEYGRLHFPVELIHQSQSGNKADVDVFVLHHPLNWFQQGNLHELRSILRSSAELVLTGHEHVQGAVVVDDALTSTTAFIEGGALSASDGSPSSFNVLELDLSTDEFRSSLFEISEGVYTAREIAAPWSSYRPLPTKVRNGMPISEGFQCVIRDAGANFSHPIRGALHLEDIYVFPDLREHSEEDDDARDRISSNTLLGKSSPAKVFLFGDEKAGKTSLLYQLFRGLHHQGSVPLYLGGAEISTASQRGLDDLIDKEIARQYGIGKGGQFWAHEVRDRVCLLDDYDRIRLNERYRAKLVRYIEERFARVIVTSSEAYQLNEYISEVAADAFADYRSFSILQLGHRLRYQLIKKWTCGGVDSVMPLDQMTAVVDRAEKIIDGVLGRNFVPAVPMYLLTLLQSIEAGRSSDLSQSAFGHYYSFLISRDFDSVKVRPEEFDELLNYCANLAYRFTKLGKRELIVREVNDFTEWYGRTFSPVRTEERIDKLCQARVLIRRGDVIGFRYPYYRYYFLGKYYADNIGQAETRDELTAEVRQKCRNLHVRENANVVLFLTHHSKEPFVLDEVVKVLQGLFVRHQPLRLDSDVGALGALVESTSRTVLAEWDVEKNREVIREAQDDAEEAGGEDESVAEQGGSDGDKQIATLWGEINVLFKTVELLGQVLKNYYGSIRNEEKLALMREIFRGPMRALADFFLSLGNDSDALVMEVEGEISRRRQDIPAEERLNLARRTVFHIVGIVSCVFVGKTAEAVNAATLRDLAKQCADGEGSPAAKLIQLAAILDSAEPIPFGELQTTLDMIKGNILARRILETFTFQHMYMFPTTIAEKQRLQAMLNFDIRGQRALELKTKEAKLIDPTSGR